MASEKDRYSEIAAGWLQGYLRKHYLKTHDVHVEIPKSKISHLTGELIKTVENYPLLDFKPDVLGILVDKKTSKTSLVFLNRSVSAISVKEIGEMNVYGIVANPLLAFLVSLKGLSNEVNALLLNSNIESSLLGYGNNRRIVLFKLDEDGSIDKETIFPRDLKEIF